MALLLLCALCGCDYSGSRTPEQAVRHWFSLLQAQDKTNYTDLLTVYPAELIEARFDQDKYREKSPHFDKDIDWAWRSFEFQAWVFASSLLQGKISEQDTQKILDTESTDARFLITQQYFDFKELKVLRVDVPKRASDPVYVQGAADTAGIYGAEGITERIALVEYAGKLYWAAFQLIRYDGNWWIQDLDTRSTGAVETTQEDYLEVLED